MTFKSCLVGLVGLVAWAHAAPALLVDDQLDEFIAAERPIALQGALNNIGPNGSLVPGAHAGFVVASPSKENPDYFFTWSRDSALTMKMLVDEFILGREELQVYIEDYYHAQAVLQTVVNPSGGFLPSGRGLGEPKYNVDGTRFNGAWGRPQRDGPALRAITLITYCNWLVENGEEEKARSVIWPVIANDLSYVGQYWNATGFDLWEEVLGSSFFTTQNQYRSLIEGAQLANTLGVTCTGCDQAPQVLCFLQTYWNGEYFVSNTNVNNGRSGKDANSMLGSISVFDVKASCDSPTIQPCNSRALASFKAWVDAFRDPAVYPINAGIPQNEGVAVGRYTEDIYYGGNPWYLITFGAAEFLYDAVAQWNEQRAITVDSTSLSFFTDLYPSATAQTYRKCNKDSDFAKIVTAVTAYADSFVAVGQQFTPSNGSLSEQFNKTLPGNPFSAHDLTWSYAAFVTMAERRAGEYPPSWAPSAHDLPATCAGTSTPGVYAPAIAAGAPNVTGSCSVLVTFVVNATTYFGEDLYVLGNSTDLGAWDINNAAPMGAGNYTAERPMWYVEIEMTAGETVSYTYARREDCGQGFLFETANRTLAVPACNTTESVATDDAWIGPGGTSGNC